MNIMFGVWFVGAVAGMKIVPMILRMMREIEDEQKTMVCRKVEHTFAGDGNEPTIDPGYGRR